MSIRVLLVDDHKILRAGVRLILEQEGMEIVAEAENGALAVEAARESTPDVVVMDLTMPTMNGIDATRLIKAAGTGSAVLILSVHMDKRYICEALKAGAPEVTVLDAQGWHGAFNQACDLLAQFGRQAAGCRVCLQRGGPCRGQRRWHIFQVAWRRAELGVADQRMLQGHPVVVPHRMVHLGLQTLLARGLGRQRLGDLVQLLFGKREQALGARDLVVDRLVVVGSRRQLARGQLFDRFARDLIRLFVSHGFRVDSGRLSVPLA